MCGICGFNWDDKNLIVKMIETQKHRGPNDSGHYVDENVSLGHTRLSIIDLSEKGKQPIHNEDDSIWIVFNGEIYNYKSTKKELIKKGHKFYTETDTEVIIHAYEEYGTECLVKLNGQFAFCIFDTIKKELFLGRDRFGIKPLYYLNKNGRFIFASEIKCILNYDLERKVNKNALNEYFTYRYSLAPNTLFENIKKLKPAHYMVINLKSNNLDIKKYFHSKISKINVNSVDEYSKKLANLLIDSVKLRMTADVPVACLLSGGIDSSIITGLASKFNSDINTFSVGFETSSELKYAKIVSDYFNTTHHELVVTNEDVLLNMDKMIYHMDEPIGDPGFFPTLLISELASKHNKVVLAGEGADEIFGGYDKYKLYVYGRKISFIFPKLNYQQEILKRIAEFSKLSESQGYSETIQVFESKELDRLEIKQNMLSNYWIKNANLFQKMQNFDIKTLMPEDFFMKADKMSSAFGLEERVPYMDHRLVEFALNLPTRLKLHFWNEKFLLKKTFSKFLPKIIIKRRKRGYNVPMDYWFKKILNYRLLDLFKENHHNLYNQDYIYELLRRIANAGENYKKNFYLAQKLWTIYVFEEWYNKYII